MIFDVAIIDFNIYLGSSKTSFEIYGWIFELRKVNVNTIFKSICPMLLGNYFGIWIAFFV